MSISSPVSESNKWAVLLPQYVKPSLFPWVSLTKSFIGATIEIKTGASFEEYFKLVAFKIRLFSFHYVVRHIGSVTVTFINYD